ncbi:MAG: DUF1549 domain-containing protein [Verrucomicrobiae bacterium]|nr:DUF1549 domain-containing protein [Verrucomicrobiae bacterium]
MMRCCVRAIALCCAMGTAVADDLWTAHVAPLLQERCGECHNPIKTRSGLDLSTFAGVLRGGDRGAAVIPGRIEDSLLHAVLSAGADPHMPPKGQLSDEQIGVVRTWIESLKPVVGDAASGGSGGNTDGIPARVDEPAWRPPEGLMAHEAIDRYLERGWEQSGVVPTQPADDRTLVRRLHLDLVGRVPAEAEIEEFLRDSCDGRWGRLVDRLLSGREHARHLAGVFDVVLMGRRGPEVEQQRRDHHWFEFLERSFGENRPWDAVVRELIRGRPAPADRGAAWYLYERKNNAQAMAEALAPVVFGVQIQCAQCHDHLVAREILQAHYWGLVAAFNRTRNVDTPSGPGLAESAIGGFVSFANLKKESQRAQMILFHGRRVDEPWPADGEKEVDDPSRYRVPPPADQEPVVEPAYPLFSRREALAEAVTVGNPLLARAMVNRVWALLFGRGLVHPVELMDSKHPPSHPDLLAWLTADFASNGHDLRRLVRSLVLTRGYRLDSRVPSGWRAGPETFAAALEKPLSAEQWVASLRQVLGDPADPGTLRRTFVRRFPDLLAPEYHPTLQQALFLSNAPEVDSLFEPSGRNLATALVEVSGPRERARRAIRAVYGRDPDAVELREASEHLAGRAAGAGVKQLLWALTTSAEFQLNH